jgi:hypothetical protein
MYSQQFSELTCDGNTLFCPCVFWKSFYSNLTTTPTIIKIKMFRLSICLFLLNSVFFSVCLSVCSMSFDCFLCCPLLRTNDSATVARNNLFAKTIPKLPEKKSQVKARPWKSTISSFLFEVRLVSFPCFRCSEKIQVFSVYRSNLRPWSWTGGLQDNSEN